MIEIKNISDYKNFLESMSDLCTNDNFISNFLHAFNRIHVGCACKIKARINATEQRKNESIANLSNDFKTKALEKFNEEINFYSGDELILSIKNE